MDIRRSKLLNARTGQFLRNDGSGDWAQLMTVASTDALPDFEADFELGEENQLATIRFTDIDNDKQIDLVRSTPTATTIYRNQGMGGFVVEDDVEDIGAGFLEDGLQLADMNGDGLLDAVQLLPGQLRYRLNLGRGTWAPWKTVVDLPITPGNIGLVQLEDLNGDALSDLVIVSGSSVQYALNRNGERFFAIEQFTSAEVDGELPERAPNTSVLYADMNGNGSSDIVWTDSNGRVTFLELFPVRPNLLSRIENGLGSVTEVTYGTSVEHMARDGGSDAWAHRLPHPMLVVDRIDTYDLLTDIHEITQFQYHDGFYDGIEKQFRGYARVESNLLGDASQEPGITRYLYDVGASDPYRNGLLLEQQVESGSRVLSESRTTYEDCPLSGVPNTTELPVRYVCSTHTSTLEREGSDPSDWVTLENHSTYDGYGNVTLSASLGVTQIGSGGCAPCERDASVFGEPCGPQCIGDEMYTETRYVSPDNTGGRWLLNAPTRERMWGREGSDLIKETQTYYDGAAFEGLPSGQLTEGRISRVTHNINPGSDAVITSARYAYNDHGQVIETLDPLGTPDGHTHRRRYSYDAENLRVVRVEVLLEDPQNQPYSLVRDIQYEPLFDKPVESTAWMRMEQGQSVSARRSSFFTYDTFGRIISRVLPGGDSIDSPTEVYTYELNNPISRIIVRKRSQLDGPLDLESIRCIDGRGRTFQTRTRLEAERYQVTGFTRFNVRSGPVEVYQPYTSPSAHCDTAPPANLLATTHRYDATYRSIEVTQPDAGLYGAPSLTRTVYGPLTTMQFDPEDNDPGSPHAGTPTVQRTDGQGRLVAIERYLTPDTPTTTTLTYDELGRMRGYIDPAGHEKIQEYDLLGRISRVLDPNTTDETTYQYDAASNL
ncbi:MAG: toxin TcdB middle/N-terminal domain-containing protein, partial [Myxococcota bacterium]